MISRRDLLLAGAAGAALLPLAVVSEQVPGAPRAHRFSRIFLGSDQAGLGGLADSLEARGLPVRRCTDNVTSLWFDDLWYQWKSGNVEPIAGITTWPAYFGLANVAQAAGLKLAVEVVHLPRGGAIHHQVRVSPQSASIVADWATGARDWLASGFDLLATIPIKRITAPAFDLIVPTQPHVGERGSRALVTWAFFPYKQFR